MSNRQRRRNDRSRSRPWSPAGGESAFVRPDARAHPRMAERAHAQAMAEQVRYVIDLGIRDTAPDVSAVVAEQVLIELEQLSVGAPADWLDPRFVMAEEVLTMIGNRWESGWQPADLLHYLRRGTPRLDDLGAAGVLEQHRRSGLAARAPAWWRAQLPGNFDVPAAGPGRAGWLFSADADPLRRWRRALSLMRQLRRMHRLAPLGPPPSAWRDETEPGGSRSPFASARPSSQRYGSSAVDPGLLGRVRALLAKAESTTFSAEAEALTAKAQELISRHAIDEALLQSESASAYQVSARRLYIDNPYALTKATLAQRVAEANRVRAVWDEQAGASTIVGMAGDLEQVELLFTSLLVQAVRAMTEHGDGSRTGSVNRSAGFRRSFLLAYATRIGERLSETAERVAAEYGTDLVPVLAEQQEAVDQELRRMFPSISSGGSRRVDARGWHAGTAAADQAVLPRGRLASG
ncbi:DUF2786 domain-containing protein [Microlunatus elymi]|uniref:DUF2786 domain-containing protein n=1 Tax=Microlunatus elymi TaxID=2596828 RepID=A0A516PX62_9ACTN|nr:DUF2786 domain-containing protein [Microlunatus elymi]QDP95764.1 DUF2786 domain-containing protein [Microlunatus elymi]